MPELRSLIARVQARWRVRSIAWTAAVSAAAFAVVFVMMLAFRNDTASARAAAVMAAVIAIIVSALRQRALPIGEAAQLIEAQHSHDNLIVTAAELEANPRPVRAEIRDEITRQAAARAATIDVTQVMPLLQPIVVAALTLAGAGALLAINPKPQSPGSAETTNLRPAPSFVVRVTPPAYTHRPVEKFDSPIEITALAGSRIAAESATGTVLRDWIATESTGVELNIGPDLTSRKFLSVNVIPDRPPDIRIVTPAKDSAFAEPKGRVEVAVQSTDDLGLSAVSMRFTKASGGGENVAFTEGELPLAIERRGDQHWNGRASIDLGSLGLEDGDIVVYRAVARDTNPRGTPVQSEQYLIEIGKNSMIADAGFALPADERKYAISQQMVIYKTERLIGDRKNHQSDFLEQARMIAVEQRMVRAEVVFLGGGEVEDELEEAAKSDELTEGRLQNTGRVEMLRAINAMSRAEAQLNDGRAEEALVLERQALASLERALDRRRFFLRTLPDRSRIDASRRLTGDRRDASSWDRQRAVTAAPASLDGQRALMRELASSPIVEARLAARVAAVDPSSKDLQQAAVALASAASDDARRDAVQRAMTAVASHAIRSLPGSVPMNLSDTALAGRLADQLSARPRR